MSIKLDYVKTYNNKVSDLLSNSKNVDSAVQEAIGGSFYSMGLLEKELLVQHGLTEDSYLIDVGCGSGRLAIPLSHYFPKLKYLGTDIVKELLGYAKEKTALPNYRFELINSITIPESENKADMICFFSVFTHLLHEETYIYLMNAKKVLKPGGKIVFSFLEFVVPPHWTVFENDYKNIGDDKPLNMFISRDAIDAWCQHLDFDIEAIYRGDIQYIELSSPVRLEDGTIATDRASLGQSACVLRVKK